MKSTPWLRKYIAPICTRCGVETKNTSLICTLCRQTCPLCSGPKSYHAKICINCRNSRKKGKKGKRRVKSNRRSVPTLVTLENGTIIQTRSILESLWLLEIQHCSFVCYECRTVPCTQVGKFGPFTGEYLPDLLLQDKNGNEFLTELKPTAEMAKNDTRPQRSLVHNNSLKFIIIGGEPHEPGGFFVRLLSSEGTVDHENVELKQLMTLLGCEE